MSEMEASGHDLYLRHTDKSGKSHIECHRVWDALRFLNSQEKSAKVEGGSISVVEPEQYMAYRRSQK